MTSWIEADKVAEQLAPGMTVFVAGTGAEPREILDALGRQAGRCAGVHFVSVSIPGINNIDFSAYHPETRSTAFFATRENRDSIAAGRVDFVPLQYRTLFDYLEHDLPVDVVMLQLPSFDDADVLSLGIWADFVPAVIDKAGLVIGEINPRQPTPVDSPTWPLARLDIAVPCNRPVPVFPTGKIDATARQIANHVAELIRDGDCIQIGIGAIPNAVLDALKQKNDLGVQSGMITDGVMALAEAGNITGRFKKMDTDKIVTGTTLGNMALIEWAGATPELRFRPVSHTHDVSVIRQIDNFVAINSALEVDLFGQVNADMLAGRQTGATGGSIDMMRGAALSRGGRSIIALRATAANGEVSRIVAALPEQTAATALRTDVDYIVTEYGARRIRHLSTAARTEALIEIAAPEFRDQLRADWRGLTAG